MTATNHAITGTAIGVIVGNPWLAVPGAILSHYICDAIPHFKAAGNIKYGDKFLKSRWFHNYLIADAAVCFLIEVALVTLKPTHWPLAMVCAFLATTPDFIAFDRFKKANQNKKFRPGKYVRFSVGIQWFERPIGALVEAAWFIAAMIILAPFVR